ncbi:hypothetical protein J6590_097889 [Homalodisca vitripennis]|nr:hypothetical protein J6590_097889 [Homalodisca vitripennis]
MSIKRECKILFGVLPHDEKELPLMWSLMNYLLNNGETAPHFLHVDTRDYIWSVSVAACPALQRSPAPAKTVKTAIVAGENDAETVFVSYRTLNCLQPLASRRDSSPLGKWPLLLF